MGTLHQDLLFAPLDADLHLERIGGGNETEVYRTDDQQFVVKVKSEEAGTPGEAYQQALILRRAARRFARMLGRQHSIPTYVLIAENEHGQAQPLVVQPYFGDAQPLSQVDYSVLSRSVRRRIAWQLLHIIYRAVTVYFRRGAMPDLYGRVSASHAERQQLNSWRRLPHRLKSFLFERTLLRANNLLLTADRRVILVDYDPIKQGKLYQLLYYSVRLVLFVRDAVLILRLLR